MVSTCESRDDTDCIKHRTLLKRTNSAVCRIHRSAINKEGNQRVNQLTQVHLDKKRPRDASCLYSFNTKRRAQSFIISCFGFRYTTAYN